MSNDMQNLPEQQVAELSPGVFTYISPNRYALNNPGAIAGNRHTLIVDSMACVADTMFFAEGVRKAVAPRPISFFVYTHAHPDHTLGSNVYDGAVFIAAKALQASFDRFKIIPGEADWPVDVRGVGVRDCSILFDERLTLDLGDRRVELIHFGNCHHDSDTVVYVPDCKVMFCGDLLFNKAWPEGAKCNLSNWIAAIDQMLGMDVETYVPGHGPVAGKEDLKKFQDCLRYIYDTTAAGFRAGMHPREIARTMSLGEFSGWHLPTRRINIVDIVYRTLQGMDPMTSFCQWDINAELDSARAAMGDTGRRHRVITKPDPAMDPDTWNNEEHRVKEDAESCAL